MINENEILREHEYDGIQELDNPLPGWWLITFFGTIIFGFIYFIHYQFGGGLLPAAELKIAMAQIESMKKGGPAFSEDKLAALFNHENQKKGQLVYNGKCAACHGPDGGGLIGPNLTDKSWIHGKGTRMDIVQVIARGVPEKGMPAWQEQLNEDEIVHVASYIYAIKGTFAESGKPAQGQEF